jgi:hypothetical protein
MSFKDSHLFLAITVKCPQLFEIIKDERSCMHHCLKDEEIATVKFTQTRQGKELLLDRNTWYLIE